MPQLRLHTQVPYGPHPRQRCEVHINEAMPDGSLVLLVHSTWWQRSDPIGLRPLALRLAEIGRPAAILAMRHLTDGASGGDLVDDLAHGISTALEEHQILGGEGRRVVPVAFGAAVVPVLLWLHQQANGSRLRIPAVVAIAGFPSLAPWPFQRSDLHRHLQAFAGPNLASLDPGRLPAKELPPLLVLHDERDDEVPASVWDQRIGAIVDAEGVAQKTFLPGLRCGEVPSPSLMPLLIDRISGFLAANGT